MNEPAERTWKFYRQCVDKQLIKQSGLGLVDLAFVHIEEYFDPELAYKMLFKDGSNGPDREYWRQVIERAADNAYLNKDVPMKGIFG